MWGDPSGIVGVLEKESKVFKMKGIQDCFPVGEGGIAGESLGDPGLMLGRVLGFLEVPRILGGAVALLGR